MKFTLFCLILALCTLSYAQEVTTSKEHSCGEYIDCYIESGASIIILSNFSHYFHKTNASDAITLTKDITIESESSSPVEVYCDDTFTITGSEVTVELKNIHVFACGLRIAKTKHIIIEATIFSHRFSTTRTGLNHGSLSILDSERTDIVSSMFYLNILNTLDVFGDTFIFGGGLHVSGGGLLNVYRSNFTDNLMINAARATPNDSIKGGGLYAEGLDNITINACLFANNRIIAAFTEETNEAVGGALYLAPDVKHSMISNSVFTGNILEGASSANYSAFGCTIYSGSDLILESSYFNSNECRYLRNDSHNGLAVWAQESKITISNTVMNKASTKDIECHADSSVHLEANVMYCDTQEEANACGSFTGVGSICGNCSIPQQDGCCGEFIRFTDSFIKQFLPCPYQIICENRRCLACNSTRCDFPYDVINDRAIVIDTPTFIDGDFTNTGDVTVIYDEEGVFKIAGCLSIGDNATFEIDVSDIDTENTNRIQLIDSECINGVVSIIGLDVDDKCFDSEEEKDGTGLYLVLIPTGKCNSPVVAISIGVVAGVVVLLLIIFFVLAFKVKSIRNKVLPWTFRSAELFPSKTQEEPSLE